ncbi:conserved membrane hypothetical protein [uncultured delta proteobacterium]|uniref:DUF112 domain-containing protein n=1 Tax=uncultured delta proteobacterium TaxID=34034 RepID=A0A212JKE2_9DELT|nr:conserved membrane hypothetical protein [uncultured delta proteobacterium]
MFDALVFVCTDPIAILLTLGGVVMGLIFGAIPGLTATLGVALLIPVSFSLSPLHAMMLLGGVYIGGISGGLVSAILINMPGTPSSICTTYDGHPMAKKGRASEALTIGVVSSFVGGIFSWVALVAIAPQLAKIALGFAPYEYFWLTVFGLTVIIGMETKSPLKALLGTVIGLVIAAIGMDPVGGVARFDFDIRILRSGFRMVPVLMGFFVVTEILSSLREFKDKYTFADSGLKTINVDSLMEEKGETVKNMGISSVIGTFLGILPGVGGATANFISYDVVKKGSKHPERFGTGYAQGIVASETGNNAVTGGAIIPMMTLGIPGDSVTAVMLGAMMIHGLRPGPMMFNNSAEVVYPFFISILLANIFMILVQFLGGIKVSVRALRMPKWVLFPLVILMLIAGTWTLQYSAYDVWTVFLFGFLGYYIKRFGVPMTPIVLGVILGPTMEDNLRRGLVLSKGSLEPFLTRDFSMALIAAILLTLAITLTISYKGRKKKVAEAAGFGRAAAEADVPLD